MNKVNQFLLRYVLWALPAVIILFIWSSFVEGGQLNSDSAVLQFLWSMLGINLMLWFLVAFYLMIYLIVSAKTRESVFGKLAGIKERDERESYIAGKAAKSTFLASIAILILLLFLSILSFDAEMVPLDPDLHDGKTQELVGGIGITLKAFDTPSIQDSVMGQDKIVDYHEIPITKTGIIILLLLWQLGAYHYFAKRLRE